MLPTADAATVAKIVSENIANESRLHTDESRLYVSVGQKFAAHETVKHSAQEYARGDVHTNTVEGYFSIFKRGMRGNYQHCAEKNLHRYLAEFDFRYNTRTDDRWGTCSPCGSSGVRQAADVSATSLSRIFLFERSGFTVGAQSVVERGETFSRYQFITRTYQACEGHK